MTTADEHEKDFTVEEQFKAHLDNLAMTWQELGLDPDDFLRCALCREFIVDPDNNFEYAEHCQNTTYVVRNSLDIEVVRVLAMEGGFKTADRIAKGIRGRLYGIDIEGKEVRMAFYDRVPPKED